MSNNYDSFQHMSLNLENKKTFWLEVFVIYPKDQIRYIDLFSIHKFNCLADSFSLCMNNLFLRSKYVGIET